MHRYVFRRALCAFIGCLIIGAIVLQGGLARTARASGETVNMWLTTPDQANLLSPQPNLTFGDIGSNSTTITINDAQTYQQMVGFGASLTDSSASLISQMSQDQRDQLMTNLFDPTNGIGLDFLRQPIGSSDLALTEYTYDDVLMGSTDPNLNNFSIAHDTPYILPLLQQARRLNPNSFGPGNIEDVAFKNPDGSKVLVVYNGGGATTFQVAWNNEAFSYTLPAGAAATFTWSDTGSTSTPPGSGSSYYLVNRNSGLALDDTNGSMTNGTIMQQWAQTNGDTNQEWSLVPADNGYYYIVNRNSGLALDDTNGSMSNGTQMQLWAQTSGDANQEWSLVQV